MTRSFHNLQCLARGLLLLFLGVAVAPAHGMPVRIGPDFIETNLASTYFGFFIPGEGFDNTFVPFDITDPSTHAIQDGGLMGYSKAQVQRAVASQVDQIFRQVDTGDATTTLAISFQLGPVSSSLPGRPLNVILGSHPLLPALGESVLNSGFNEVAVPDGEYPIYANLRTLDGLAGVSFTTPESVINNIAGTTAHEVAHLFGLEHVGASISDPKPIMASGSAGDPLSTSDRLAARAFSSVIGTQGVTDSSASLLVSNLGAVNRSDFDMDGMVTAATDGATFLANLGLTDRLFIEGDADGDGIVTASKDGALLLASLGSGVGPLMASREGFTSFVIPEPTTSILAAIGLN